MKKSICFLVVLVVLFVSTGLVAHAVSFEGDASYLFGIGSSKSRGFTAHAMVEVMDHIFVDGSFLSTNATKTAGDDETEISTRNNLFNVGGLYRPVNDADLQVFVGGGFASLTTKVTESEDVTSRGIYGKFGFKFLPMPQLSILSDVSYAPKFKQKDTETSTGHLITARFTASYEVMDGVGVQGTIKHFRTFGTGGTSDTLVGGGVTFRF